MALNARRSPAAPGGRTALPDEARPLVDPSESPLAWLRRRKEKSGKALIDEHQFAAGERLRADYTFGQLMPSVTMGWRQDAGGRGRGSSPGNAVDLQDGAIAARERVNRALVAVGPELSGILVDVCCHLKGLEASERDRGWPLRSAKVVLRLGLSSLARHYGIGEAAGRGSDAAKVRHWGADNYRPRVHVPVADGGDEAGVG